MQIYRIQAIQAFLSFSSLILAVTASYPAQAKLFNTTEAKVKDLAFGGTPDVITKIFTFIRVITVLIFLGAIIYSIFIARQRQKD